MNIQEGDKVYDTKDPKTPLPSRKYPVSENVSEQWNTA